MKVSRAGALVGALVGALARAGVVLYHLGGSLNFLALPSAGIGALVGAIAGAPGRPLRGALIGAVLSGVIFELFLLSCVSLVGTLGGSGDSQLGILSGGVPYALQMAAAGALAGAVGGAVGSRGVKPEKPPIDQGPI